MNSFRNTFIFSVKKKLRFLLRWLTGGLLSLFLFFLAMNILFPLRVEVPYAQLVLAEDGSLLHGFLSEDDKWRFKTELDEIQPDLRKAILHKEDRYFYYHFGINPVAVLRAASNNLRKGRRTSGASTISMQVVRLLNPKERTYGNKLIEMFRSFQLEWQFSKDEILQLYLNLVPYGGNIEGVKAASLLYFGQMPDKLSLAQLTALSIIPNRPTSLALGRQKHNILQARNRWLKRFRKADLFPKNRIADALAEPLDANYQPLPRKAPHLSLRLYQKYTQNTVNQSFINQSLQEKIRKLTFNYSRRTRPFNIHNAAVLVVDNASRKVVAYIGSQDFSDKEHAGEVDGIQAWRSPGSTLKPLLYGMAFDEGSLSPQRRIADVPVNFDGYTPHNFNSRFNGYVSVETALAYSLNVPAVKVLNDLGVHRMIDKLERAQFSHIQKSRRNLGLSLALGGCGVSLEELCGLFTAFANGGSYRPLLLSAADSSSASKPPLRLLSEESSWMVTDILTRVQRPDLPSDYQNSRNVPKIAWKTGTSYGRHDAWSIGYNARYTVGVWLGNFSGDAAQALTGATMATPLLFKIFQEMEYNTSNNWPEIPEGLSERMVCNETGLLPSSFCTSQVAEYFIPMISQSIACTHMKYVFVDSESQMSFCSHCLPKNGKYNKRLYPNHPPEVRSWYAQQQIEYEKPPEHNPGCTHIGGDENEPRITSPAAEREYRSIEGEVQLKLSCQAAAGVDTVHWFVNDRFLKSVPAGQGLFCTPPKGRVKISCSDDQGRNTDLFVLVR